MRRPVERMPTKLVSLDPCHRSLLFLSLAKGLNRSASPARSTAKRSSIDRVYLEWVGAWAA